MWQNAQNAYLESRVLSAEPVELICLMYQAATQAVRDARRHLAAGEIRERARAIGHAQGILNELSSSLDHGQGGEISRGLARLYDYMRRQLTEAHFRQVDAPLAEVLGLLQTLLEGWEGIRPATPATPQAAAGVWANAASPAAESRAWSF